MPIAYTASMAQPNVAVRNTLAYAIPELFWGITWAISVDLAMVAAFSDDFGGSQGFIGLAMLLGSFGLGVPLLLSAFWVEPLRSKRGFVFWGHIAGGLALLLAAGLIWIAADALAARVAFLAGTTLFFVSVGLLIPGWLALVGELFRSGTQARVLGVTFFANKLAAAFAGHFIGTQVLATSWSPTDKWTLLFSIAGVAALVGSFPFLWIVERVQVRPPRPPFRAYLGSLLGALREIPALRRFVVADAVGISVLVTFTFYADAAIRTEGVHNSRSGDWVMIGALAMMAMSALIAVAGERVRPRAWLCGGLLCGAGASVAAACGGSTLSYDMAAVGLGLWLATRASCHAPQVMRLAPERDGTAPIGVAMALVMPVQGLGPWLAGEWVIPGTSYAHVFWAVAGLASVAALLLLFWVPRGGPRSVGPRPAQ